MRLSMIASLGRNYGIGKDGKLLWSIPDDLKRFKTLTNGHPVIMGRKTWESLPERFRPLPGRTNFVITSQDGYQATGAKVVHSFNAAYVQASHEPGVDEVFVIGGERVYADGLVFADRLCLTLVDGEQPSDAYFPTYEQLFKKVSEEERAWDGLHYRWADFERR